jgi:hypothetical protein
VKQIDVVAFEQLCDLLELCLASIDGVERRVVLERCAADDDLRVWNNFECSVLFVNNLLKVNFNLAEATGSFELTTCFLAFLSILWRRFQRDS